MGDHLYEREQVLDLPIDEVFRFFTDARNLAAITPAALHFRFDAPPPAAMGLGAEVRYRVRLKGIPVRWESRVTLWEPPHRFADLQVRGPYEYWLHTHSFEALGPSRTVMRDRVVYRVPMGVLGELARRAFVARQVKAIFDHREASIVPALRAAAGTG